MKTTLKIFTTLFLLTCSLSLVGAEQTLDAPTTPEQSTVQETSGPENAPAKTDSGTIKKPLSQPATVCADSGTPDKVKSAYAQSKTKAEKTKEIPMSKMIVKTVLAFSFVIGLMLLIAFAYKYLLAKTGYMAASGAGEIRIIERSMLDAKKQICLIRVKNREYLLVNQTGAGTVVLDKFDINANEQEKQG